MYAINKIQILHLVYDYLFNNIQIQYAFNLRKIDSERKITYKYLRKLSTYYESNIHLLQ